MAEHHAHPELTKNEAIQNHRKMWNWIAEQTKARKKPVDKKEYISECDPEVRHITSTCWLCEYAEHHKQLRPGVRNGHACNACPLRWPNEKIITELTNETTTLCFGTDGLDNPETVGLYGRWYYATLHNDWERCYDLAKQIENMPEYMEDKP